MSIPRIVLEALRRIDLGIREGEFLALLGQNGSGKTTLAKHFNGLLKPTRGQMLLRGRPTNKYRQQELARLVGYVFQNPDHQIFSNTVYEEVAFGLRMLGEDVKNIKGHISEALAVVGLDRPSPSRVQSPCCRWADDPRRSLDRRRGRSL